MNLLVGVAILAVVAVALLGWLVPLVVGLVQLRRRTGGVVLAVIGAIWGFAAIGVAGLGAVAYRQMSRSVRVEDFDPASYHGATGTVLVTYAGQSELIVRDKKLDKRLRLHARDGIAQAPVGKFEVESWEALATDSQGITWTASCYPGGGRAAEMAVAAGGAPRFEVGPPFTASVDVRPQASGRVAFELKVAGLGGYSYPIHSSRARPPGFQALDRSRRVVWHGDFEYG